MGDVKRYECFAHEGMTEDAAGSYVRLDDYQSEKARADAAEAELAAMKAKFAPPPKFTTGHCERHQQAGGCPLHNLSCGWPKCDQRPIEVGATHD